MRTMTLADAKAHLSAVVDEVEAGEVIVITRRGRAVARIVAEPSTQRRDPTTVLAAQRRFLAGQPMLTETAAQLVRRMRDEERY